MNTTAQTLMALLRNAVTEAHETPDPGSIEPKALFALADHHDLAHIVCRALERSGNLSEENLREKWLQRYNMALFRHARRELTIAGIRDALEQARVPFILLKGAVLMELYPEPWMRTSADVDVLVREPDLATAADRLAKAGMTQIGATTHDVSFTSTEQCRVELHYSLMEDFELSAAARSLQNVWDHAVPRQANAVEHVLSDADFYFFHIAHMAKHFKRGGTGIRSLLDLWLLNHKIPFDAQKRSAQIEKGGLSAFEKHVRALSEVWFSTGENDPSLYELEQYILYGGLYGTFSRRVAMQKKKKNRFAYYFGRLFLPYRQMKISYPVLKKCPILLPFFWIARWFKLLRPSVRRQTAEEIKAGRAADSRENERTEMLLKQLEIW